MPSQQTKAATTETFRIDRLKDRDVASGSYDELESELQGVQAQQQSLDEKYKKLKEIIQRVATNTIGYTRKQANKE
jgi:chaperonin cofactor prefoldin